MIAVLITCYNRKNTTLTCLRNLYEQDIAFDVFLVDDGSTDGTGAAVRAHFPKVKIFTGDGNLFWNRGMRLAWQKALEEKTLYDYFLWLNDDTHIYTASLKKLLNYSVENDDKAIICSAIQDADRTHFTYGGRNKNYKPHKPNGSLQKIHFMNGNLVLIPHYVVDKIGILDKAFKQHLGDYDYGLRAIKAGIAVYTTPEYLGSCERNEALTTRARKVNVNLKERFKFLYSPLGVDPIAHFKYHKRHFGYIKAIKHFILSNLNNLAGNKLHGFYKEKIMGKKNKSKNQSIE